MDTITMLKKFAEVQGIDVSEVDKFMNSFKNPSTLDELLEFPESMLTHSKYINDIPFELSEFITKEIEPRRCQVVKLDRVADFINDRIGWEEMQLEKGKIDKETFEENVRQFKIAEKQIIETKFGSVVNDW